MYVCQVMGYHPVMAGPATPPVTRPRNVRGEGDRLREQLLEATVSLLESEGDAARLSVRAIAKAAGVSPTALYLQFPDRDTLVSAAVDRGFAAFNETLRSAAESESEPRAQLRVTGVAYLNFAESQPALYAVIFSSRRPTRQPTESGAVVRDEGLKGLIALVAAIRPSDGQSEARELALTLWAALHGYATLHARTPVRRWPKPARYVDRLMRAHLGV